MDDEHAPIVCIGDSYNGGFMETPATPSTCPSATSSDSGDTTEAFKDFLRDPAIGRVVSLMNYGAGDVVEIAPAQGGETLLCRSASASRPASILTPGGSS